MIRIIKLYQKIISPLLGDNCRFYPSCSQYMLENLQNNTCFTAKLWGFWQGIKRILKCHPFNAGGVDMPKIKEQRN